MFNLENIYKAIDLDEDFSNIKVIDFYVDIDDKVYIPLNTFDINGLKEKIPLKEYNGTLVPYYFKQIKEKNVPKTFHRLYKNYYEILRHLIIQISIREKINLDEISLYFKKQFSLNQKETNLLIKLAIAANDIFVKEKSNNLIFGISQKNIKIRNKVQFLATVIDEVKGKSKRISNLISHSGTVGSYRENLLMSVLRKYLPKKFSISSGFIEKIPRQIDILIYDSHNYIPLFDENGIAVVKKEAVRAVIEVKSKMGQKELNEALDLLYDISKTQTVVPIFKGIFTFDTTYRKSVTIAKNIKKFYNKKSKIGIKEYPLNYMFQSLDILCVLDKHLVNIAHNNDNGIITPCISSVKSKYNFKYEGAYFLNKLFKFIDVEVSSRKINNEFFWELDKEIEVEHITNIYDDEWLKLGFRIGRKSLKNSTDFNKRYEDVIKWVDGKITTNQLYDLYE